MPSLSTMDVKFMNYTNPIVPEANCPDPGTMYYNGAYYVATTTGNISLEMRATIEIFERLLMKSFRQQHST